MTFQSGKSGSLPPSRSPERGSSLPKVRARRDSSLLTHYITRQAGPLRPVPRPPVSPLVATRGRALTQPRLRLPLLPPGGGLPADHETKSSLIWCSGLSESPYTPGSAPSSACLYLGYSLPGVPSPFLPLPGQAFPAYSTPSPRTGPSPRPCRPTEARPLHSVGAESMFAVG